MSSFLCVLPVLLVFQEGNPVKSAPLHFYEDELPSPQVSCPLATQLANSAQQCSSGLGRP